VSRLQTDSQCGGDGEGRGPTQPQPELGRPHQTARQTDNQRAVHSGDVFGIAATGRRMTVSGIEIYASLAGR